ADLVDEGTFHEYGGLAVAGQRQRHSLQSLIERTPADGVVTGTGSVNGLCVIVGYDYTVWAGTQGHQGHRKVTRMLELAHRRRLPVVIFGEGGGGRAGETDGLNAFGLDIPTWRQLGLLSGVVPLVGVVAGYSFAGNAAMLGGCDVIIATQDSSLGMGGPAMIEGGGLGTFTPDEVGPMAVQGPNGVVDLVVEDDRAAVAAARRYLSYFQGRAETYGSADQTLLRDAVPENRARSYDMRAVVDLLTDTASVLELRKDFGPSIITALGRVEGWPLGIVASNPMALGGAIDSAAADKMTRFVRVCETFDLPVLSLCDTPGILVGPEAEKEATVRHAARLFVATASLRVPLLCVVLRKAYGLGAQAMFGGSVHAPFFTVAWPTAQFGSMGVEGMVRLGFRRELDQLEDEDERRRFFDEQARSIYEKGSALTAATYFELDDVIDPADTRSWIATALHNPRATPGPASRPIDPW
ncbi:MAG: biotin carboxylase, partial [Acidimicrobiaceae bacterium]|nr:biotin carboxylase [Acidimicrobiaceae bacterium]